MAYAEEITAQLDGGALTPSAFGYNEAQLRLHAGSALSLTQAQRKGIITLRGHEILNSLPKQRQALPAARDFRELLSLSTETKEIEGQ